ncbi:hypothetical protein EIJ81_00655 (plasmid) [Aliivibrio salmonicida]|uniref:hypothetical protein n=1 Tax=Aliivibrio salmonicida TaxID=40269 RepID=UPI000F70C3BC|nr:hypothetical protein [Aliivibrio salmonicida]AZL83409.1 hypothetical protein EIJ81_00655 [Aliivibrio salmonicida]
MIPSLTKRTDVNITAIDAAIKILVSKHENGLLKNNLKQIENEMNVARNTFIKKNPESVVNPKSICNSTMIKFNKLNKVKLKVFMPTDPIMMPLL